MAGYPILCSAEQHPNWPATEVVILTPLPGQDIPEDYEAFQRLVFIGPATNATHYTLADFNGLGPKKVYGQSTVNGPTVKASWMNEACICEIAYDPALDSEAGGFQVIGEAPNDPSSIAMQASESARFVGSQSFVSAGIGVNLPIHSGNNLVDLTLDVSYNCDPGSRIEFTIMRSVDGGTTWTNIAPEVNPSHDYILAVSAPPSVSHNGHASKRLIDLGIAALGLGGTTTVSYHVFWRMTSAGGTGMLNRSQCSGAVIGNSSLMVVEVPQQ